MLFAVSNLLTKSCMIFMKKTFYLVQICLLYTSNYSQGTLTMFVGVDALCCVVLIMEGHNSYKHGQSPLTRVTITL